MCARRWGQHQRPVAQQQLQAAAAAGGAAVVQRSDAVDGGAVHLQRQSPHDPAHPTTSDWKKGPRGSSTHIGPGVDQRSHTGHVSRQAGLMERGHMIDSEDVGGVPLRVMTAPLNMRVRAGACAYVCVYVCRQHLGQQGAQCEQAPLRSSFVEGRTIGPRPCKTTAATT